MKVESRRHDQRQGIARANSHDGAADETEGDILHQAVIDAQALDQHQRSHEQSGHGRRHVDCALGVARHVC
jgi:hypothetical protein